MFAMLGVDALKKKRAFNAVLHTLNLFFLKHLRHARILVDKPWACGDTWKNVFLRVCSGHCDRANYSIGEPRYRCGVKACSVGLRQPKVGQRFLTPWCSTSERPLSCVQTLTVIAVGCASSGFQLCRKRCSYNALFQGRWFRSVDVLRKALWALVEHRELGKEFYHGASECRDSERAII